MNNGAMVKFATQIEEKVLVELRQVAAETGLSISRIVNDAVAEHLSRMRVRPAFSEAMDSVLDEHDELLTRLAK